MPLDPFLGPRAQIQNILLYVGIGLVVAFIVAFYAMIGDLRWIFAFPVLFVLTWLWIKLWAGVAGIDRDGLTPEDRAHRDKEGRDRQDGNWNA